MSDIAKTTADLFAGAQDLDASLSDVTVEQSIEQAVLLRRGNLRLLVYTDDSRDERLHRMREEAIGRGAGVLVLLTGDHVPDSVQQFTFEHAHFDYMEPPLEPVRLARHIRRIFTTLQWEEEARLARQELKANRSQLKEIQAIGVALSAERDLDRLLNLIVEKAREITHADAGSLYIAEGREEDGDRRLRFKISQNDSIEVPFSEFTLPISPASIAGYVATTKETLIVDDVYEIPDDSPFNFNASFDKNFNYRTRSMLVVPLITRAGEMIGVLQLLNRKLRPDQTLTPDTTADAVIPFTPADVELVTSLGSAAAVSLENAFLYEEIQRLFEGFVRASVTAIESRDPTTSGHSDRVAQLTVGLAEKVDNLSDGRFGNIRFSREQLREIQYASLLHDFGKIGVREQVLVKAEKLYPWDFRFVEARFKYARKVLETRFLRAQNRLLVEKGREKAAAELHELEAAYRRESEELDQFMDVVRSANRPSVLAEGDFAVLQQIAARTFVEDDGREQPLLLPDEVVNLSLPKGSLNSDERREIESHVSHTFDFLQRIPWTKELRDIPRIAFLHHEKLDGRGYPNGFAAEEIPVQSRMMTISDIYDALTASDRPYKKAVPVEKALDIIGYEVKEGLLDADLFDIFVQAEIYKLTV